MPTICIVPRVDGLGGPASFRLKFEDGLRVRGVDVTHDTSQPLDAILVLAGTRHLLPLWKARSRGQRIVQRLNGINWVHKKRNTGLKHYLRAEYGNLILSLIRSRIATNVIYQSEFSHQWWEDWYGKTPVPSSAIHNGVDLKVYSPGEAPSSPPYKILLVEGSLGGGYEMGLDNAIRLTEILKKNHNLQIELVVVGKITDEHKKKVETKTQISMSWMGAVPRERIPEIDRSAHLLFSADLNAACPNSVIEALACGLPVLSFDTGALSELVIGNAGRVVPYGGDPWNFDPPDVEALASAAVEILSNQSLFRKSAREQAEKNLGLDQMVDKYLEVLLG
ncbi:MAG TPA: glycosyltransferase family 4 protein [Anaerolineales bacterium]|nr:glycosyltransferase family 4 protein [Anaerolineales bacterium]